MQAVPVPVPAHACRARYRDVHITDPCLLALVPQMRKMLIDMVLATDMAIHFDLLQRFNSQFEQCSDMNEWKDRGLLYMMIVHLADIANPARPFSLARAWAERVIQEFCDQVCVCVCVLVDVRENMSRCSSRMAGMCWHIAHCKWH